MTGAEVKTIREALGAALGRRLSQRDLGLALGLAPKNAADTVRRWEDEGPSGPAAVALDLMLYAASHGALPKVQAIFDRADLIGRVHEAG